MKLFSKLMEFTTGRTTFFVLCFFASGNVLHIYHRLDATYITFMATLMGFVVGHSVKEDYFSKPSNAAPAQTDKKSDPQPDPKGGDD